MKLYKFRCLKPFYRIKDIIRNNRFYLPPWNDLNDPMEGFFQYMISNPSTDYDTLNNFISSKNHYRICSFSNTYHPLLLWSHYADKFKGIAIEIELNSKRIQNLYRVQYKKNIPMLHFNLNPTPQEILSKKINCWRYEREYRIIDTNEHFNDYRISGIYFGLRVTEIEKNRIKDILPSPVMVYDTKIDFDSNKVISINPVLM